MWLFNSRTWFFPWLPSVLLSSTEFIITVLLFDPGVTDIVYHSWITWNRISNSPSAIFEVMLHHCICSITSSIDLLRFKNMINASSQLKDVKFACLVMWRLCIVLKYYCIKNVKLALLTGIYGENIVENTAKCLYRNPVPTDLFLKGLDF